MKTALAMASLLLSASAVEAGEWNVGLGPSYVSGIEDVLDLYEFNMERDGYSEVDVDMLLPVGIAFSADYQWASGVRVDLGLGPVFFIAGDADHFEMPISSTVGYTFFPNSTVSPYIRAGLVHHLVSGDYDINSDPGLLAAAGIEFARDSVVKFTLEVATDQSEVEFETFACRSFNSFRICNPDTVVMNTYDLVVSLFVKF